jgi:monoamine oxidase
MANTVGKSSKKTTDGFICHSDGLIDGGLSTPAAVESQELINKEEYDVIIIGAGFAGLIAARELSLRGRKVLIVEARDRIGGRTFTAQLENRNFEIGGTWIHWSQPHVWTELTRYGLSITESKGATADHMGVLLDNGTKLKETSMADCWGAMAKAMEKYSDVDGVQGRTVIPLPHKPFAANEAVQKYDQLSIKDRYDQIVDSLGSEDDINQMLLSLLSMDMQGDIAEGGFIDHLRWWALGDYDMSRMFDKLGRYKIKEGTSALAQAILSDCQKVTLLLSTPILSIDRSSGNSVIIRTQTGQLLLGRTTIVTVPLNALQNIEFLPPLGLKKKEAVTIGQCRGGTKFWVKLEKSVGDWFGIAPYPNPITMAYTDDEEGSVIVGFGPEGILDIQNINAVEKELCKLLPNIKVRYLLAHDWRNDPFVLGTWSWYKPGQMCSSLLALQNPEPPVFFASGDISDGWRGFIDGALESGLTSVRHVQQYLNKYFA